jgi:hypothetical protein
VRIDLEANAAMGFFPLHEPAQIHPILGCGLRPNPAALALGKPKAPRLSMLNQWLEQRQNWYQPRGPDFLDFSSAQNLFRFA